MFRWISASLNAGFWLFLLISLLKEQITCILCVTLLVFLHVTLTFLIIPACDSHHVHRTWISLRLQHMKTLNFSCVSLSIYFLYVTLLMFPARHSHYVSCTSLFLCFLRFTLRMFPARNSPYVSCMSLSHFLMFPACPFLIFLCFLYVTLLMFPLCHSPYVSSMSLSLCFLRITLLMYPVWQSPYVSRTSLSSCFLHVTLLMFPAHYSLDVSRMSLSLCFLHGNGNTAKKRRRQSFKNK
jgi:hypothetical protein